MLNNNIIKNLPPKEIRYSISDERGLYLEIMPNGKNLGVLDIHFKERKINFHLVHIQR